MPKRESTHLPCRLPAALADSGRVHIRRPLSPKLKPNRGSSSSSGSSNNLNSNVSRDRAPGRYEARLRSPATPSLSRKSQLLNSMRAKASASEPHDKTLQANPPRTRKEEDDMDEDERLLASEEGKLSSKERRQLCNKVSARAFRSRRKEYISQLEVEIVVKVNENGDLRAENRALLDENKRLSDLTSMLLSSPSFSNFLDHLSVNPSTASPIRAEAQQQVPDQDQVPKNANPYRDQHSQQQQIGMAMIPEQSMEMAMLNFNGVSAYNFQPQVFVVETPEIATALVASLLSGKTQDFGDETSQPDKESKVNVPVIERCAEDFPTFVAASSATPVQENFESDSGLALVHSEPSRTSHPTTRIDIESLSVVDIDGHLDVDEVPTRHEVFNTTERDASVITAMARVQRLCQYRACRIKTRALDNGSLGKHSGNTNGLTGLCFHLCDHVMRRGGRNCMSLDHMWRFGKRLKEISRIKSCTPAETLPEKAMRVVHGQLV